MFSVFILKLITEQFMSFSWKSFPSISWVIASLYADTEWFLQGFSCSSIMNLVVAKLIEHLLSFHFVAHLVHSPMLSSKLHYLCFTSLTADVFFAATDTNNFTFDHSLIRQVVARVVGSSTSPKSSILRIDDFSEKETYLLSLYDRMTTL